MIGRAAETGVPGCDERVRDAATAADERPGENVEILALRHQIGVLERQLNGQRSGSTRAAGRFWRRSSMACHGKCCAGCGCWCGRTRYCAGTATSSPADTLPSPGRSAEAGPAPCTRSGRWCCAWPGKIQVGAIGACTVSCPPARRRLHCPDRGRRTTPHAKRGCPRSSGTQGRLVHRQVEAPPAKSLPFRVRVRVPTERPATSLRVCGLAVQPVVVEWLPASCAPFCEAGSLCAEGGVIAVAGVDPGLIGQGVEYLGLQAVHQGVEILRPCCPARTPPREHQRSPGNTTNVTANPAPPAPWRSRTPV